MKSAKVDVYKVLCEPNLLQKMEGKDFRCIYFVILFCTLSFECFVAVLMRLVRHHPEEQEGHKLLVLHKMC